MSPRSAETRCVVGIVGVGNMGGAMAGNLLERGWPVWVRDIDAGRARSLARLGARVAASAAELAAQVDVVIIAVVDAAQTEEVLFGAQGVLQGHRLMPTPHGGQRTVLLCPTIAPADVERAQDRLQGPGLELVDAPMSGGPDRARDGSMSLMVACPKALFARRQPLLQALASHLFHVGERPGDGARTKLVNNLLAGINLVGAAEVLALATRIGLDPEQTLSVIGQSSGQSWIGADRMKRALAGDLAPRAHMSLLTKDTGLALEMARQAGCESALGAMAHQMFQRACNDGLADVDDGALYPMLLKGLPTIPP